MTKPGINISKPAEKNEKPGVTIMATAVKVAPVAPKGFPRAARTMRQQCEGSYFCECRLCICGAPVEYPGDVCYSCNKFH
ncbi:hypothetical protein C7999DRAFT_30052 [Corynascus novoguineensis]|uniref:Uncharacterized protein n=1 Tax=Corynascus novoguineensis TaxID=1126955 RepID=A0AAN7CW75_9PEZI|nr:hypothetical protein C7999DRAFT_30052 [Corynascus novoguineensis]